MHWSVKSILNGKLMEKKGNSSERVLGFLTSFNSRILQMHGGSFSLHNASHLQLDQGQSSGIVALVGRGRG